MKIFTVGCHIPAWHVRICPYMPSEMSYIISGIVSGLRFGSVGLGLWHIILVAKVVVWVLTRGRRQHLQQPHLARSTARLELSDVQALSSHTPREHP